MAATTIRALEEAERELLETSRFAKRQAKTVRQAMARCSAPAVERIGASSWAACASVCEIAGDMGLALRYYKLRVRLDTAADVDEEAVRGKILASVASAGTQAGIADVDSTMHFEAARWVAEWRTFEWLLRVNYKGVAPPTQALSEQYVSQFPVASVGGRARAHLEGVASSKPKLKEWAKTFRRRWGAVYKKLPSRPDITEDEISAKACFASFPT